MSSLQFIKTVAVPISRMSVRGPLIEVIWPEMLSV